MQSLSVFYHVRNGLSSKQNKNLFCNTLFLLRFLFDKKKNATFKNFFADEKTEKNAKIGIENAQKSIQKPRLKKRTLKRGKKLKKVTSRSISRVLSCATIYLLPPLPTDSSDVLRRYRGEQPHSISPYLASGGVYTAGEVTSSPVSFYLAFSSLPFSRRFFSVALSRKSPSADVIRHPAL